MKSALKSSLKSGLKTSIKDGFIVVPIVVVTNFYSRTMKRRGGFLTAEAAGSFITGLGAADFVIDARGYIVPAGTIDAGSAVFTRSTYTLGLASGASLSLNVPVTPGFSIDPTASTEVENMFYGGPYGGSSANAPHRDEILWIRPGQWNAAGSLLSITFRSAATYTGTVGGRITAQSEIPDTSLDAYGELNLKHPVKMGRMYFDPDANDALCGDVRNLYFYDNSTTFLSGFGFLRYAQGYGIRTYGNRYEAGPGSVDTFNCRGRDVKWGDISQGERFYNLGECVTEFTTSAGAAILVQDNVYEKCYGDFHKSYGLTPFTVKGTLTINVVNGAALGLHSDFWQMDGGAWTGVGAVHQAYGNLYNSENEGANAFILFANMSSPTSYMLTPDIRYNAAQLNHQPGISLACPDNPTVQCNVMLTNPFATAALTNVEIALGYVAGPALGRNGGTVTNNICNSLQIHIETGVVTNTHNLTPADNAGLDAAAVTKPQYLATLQTMFPNYPSAINDPIWRSYAGSLRAWTPADLLVANGGVKWPDLECSGLLYPPGPGQTTGAWIIPGVTFTPLNGTWNVDHPPATRANRPV